MISVLLTLLKILGIAILVILGIVLVLLLIVLFVPVRYRIRGYYKEDFVCHLRATWLLHLVSLSVDFEKELITSIKILGMDISSFLNKKEKKQKENTKAKTNTEDKQISQNTDENEQTQLSSQKEIKEYSVQDNHTTDEAHSQDNPDSSRSIFQKIKDFITGIREKIITIYNKVKEFLINIKNKKDSVERYIRILQREEVKGAFSLWKKRIFKMIKHLLPRHMKIHIHVGMEDPATTGYILGAYSILSDKLRRQIILQADFEQVILEADYNIKGHCHAFRFLHELLCIVTDKNCRTFYKLVKKEISNERK